MRKFSLALTLLVTAPQLAGAEGYSKPPKVIEDVLLAPKAPYANVSPTRDTLLLVSTAEFPSIAQVAEPFLRLAGIRLEPRTRRKHDTSGGYGITPCVRELTLVKVATSAETKIPLPAGSCVEAMVWSADGRRLAFRVTGKASVELWVAEVATGAMRAVSGVRLNPMFGSTLQWMPDQKTLLVKLVPDGQGAPPPKPEVPPGPTILESDGKTGASSTYEVRDTLTSKHDEDLFDYYGLAQLALVDVDSGGLTRVGKPAIVDSVRPSPDGRHLLVETIERPYSHITTYDRFPHTIAIWDRGGNVEQTVAKLPLFERVPIHGVPTGPREVSWRATDPATLVWAEALDGGDWNVTVPARDKVMMLKAPFTTAPVELLRTEQRFATFGWGEQRTMALLYEYDENKHWERTFIVNVDEKKARPKLLWDMSSDELYKHPGNPVYRVLPNGAWVMKQTGDAIFLAGQGYLPEGRRPFLDRLSLKTRKTERLFRSDATGIETFLAFADDKGRSFLTWKQSPIEPPNVFLRTADGAAPRAVTHIVDSTPIVRQIKKRIVKYKRADGTDLSFTLYTPPGYKEGTRIPAILYAYPLDYADPRTAGQNSLTDQGFTQLYDYQHLLLAGYAIIDKATFPIVGDPKKAYDTYLEQLVADASAAVDKAVELGVVDRDRIGVTGHSHGALMTVNLLAHSDLFRAGAATSGSYNKTLTPFGFQSERRSVWEAQNVYIQASPFFFADKLKRPLLIIHGEDDANPGTTPLQSRKLYEAIRGNGGTARLVMLPHEPHWYEALESNEQLIAEMLQWFDKHVKNAPPRVAN